MGWGDALEMQIEKSAEKNNEQESEDGPMRGDLKNCAKGWQEEPMRRGECVGCGGVWGDDARDGEGKMRLGEKDCGEIGEMGG